MDVTQIPFNQFLGIKKAADTATHLLEIGDSVSYTNHLGTVHASVQLALAEASSGEFLLHTLPEFGDKVLAVVRRVEAKFKNPMQGPVFSRAATPEADLKRSAEALSTKGRAILPVTIEIVDTAGTVGLVATFEWFAQRKSD